MRRLRMWRTVALALLATAGLAGIGAVVFTPAGPALQGLAARAADHGAIVLSWHALLVAGLIAGWNRLPGWLGRPLAPAAATAWAAQRWRMAGWLVLIEIVLGTGWLA